MHKSFMIILFISFLLFYNQSNIISIEAESLDTIIYVDDDNTQGPWIGSKSYPFQYIGDAVDNASNGDTIFVSNGNYEENLIIDKSLNIIGEEKNDTILYGDQGYIFIEIKSDWVLLSNFTISGNYKKYALMISSSFITIKNNHIEKCGIKISGRSDILIKDNIIRYGKAQYAIECNNVKNCTFYNNIIKRARVGILIGNSKSCLVKENDIDCADIEYSFSITLSNCENSIITFNKVKKSEYGIMIRYSTNIEVNYNEISKNKYGCIHESSSCLISNNNFFLNVIHASFDHYHIHISDDHIPSIWINNYWGIPRVIPKIIWGTISIDIFSGFVTIHIPFLKTDIRPRVFPVEMDEVNYDKN